MIIYLITNSENGKCYIGKSARSVDRRWKDHLSKAKTGSNTHLHQAIRKYGAGSFSVQIVCRARCAEHLNNLERLFIRVFDTMGEHGYNLTPGGDGIAPGTRLSAEHRAKLSMAHKGKPNVGHFKKGQVPHTKGKSPTSDVRKKIAEGVSKSLVGNTRRSGKPHSAEVKSRIADSVRKSGNGAPDLMGARSRSFWAGLTPDARIEYIARREAARQASLQEKRGMA